MSPVRVRLPAPNEPDPGRLARPDVFSLTCVVPREEAPLRAAACRPSLPESYSTGKYEIVGLLGAGGMGEVYKAGTFT